MFGVYDPAKYFECLLYQGLTMICFLGLFLSSMLFSFFALRFKQEYQGSVHVILSQSKFMANGVSLDKTCKGLTPSDSFLSATEESDAGLVFLQQNL